MFIIAGSHARHRLKSPKGQQTRPTSSRLREALFNICQNNIESAQFLDIFAGSGAMGLEALSRGAQFSTFIEFQKEAIQCIESNIQHLKVEDRCRILKGEAFDMLRMLERQGKKFDIIYADPPYCTPGPHSSQFYSFHIVEWVDNHNLLVPGGILFIEEDFRFQPRLDQLKTLTLKDSRRMGPAVLQQYWKNR